MNGASRILKGEDKKERSLTNVGIDFVYHYAPLHYLPFILRSGHLRSKLRLRAEGFDDSHFRSTSAKQDLQRGFGQYVHFTQNPHPPILKAKVARGFPHFEIAIPASVVEQQTYLLCRFNIARARYFRGAKQKPPACPANGLYYGDLCLPVATTAQQKADLLQHNVGRRIIEVLVPDQLPMSLGCVLTVFSRKDLQLVEPVVVKLAAVPFNIRVDESLTYPTIPKYQEAAKHALERAFDDASWKGEGLEFDRI
jgi:hypothetical protein